MALSPKERTRRYRAKKRGESIEVLPLGPKKGYKQSADHVEKRKRFGVEHANWIGDDVSEKGGRTRAIRMFADIGPCVSCGCEKSERHHVDGNTANNEPENIVILCRRCHMETDGRLARFAAMNGRKGKVDK